MWDVLAHYGTPRHSGRYPWGSGKNPYQRSRDFYGKIQDLKKRGMTDTQIAKSFGMSTGEYRAKRSNAKQDIMRQEIAMARKLKAKGYSNAAIGRIIGKPDTTVGKYLQPDYELKSSRNQQVADVLRQQCDERGYILVGKGTEHWIGTEQNGLNKISETRKNAALDLLREEGYEVISFDTKQMGTSHETTVKVLAPKGTTKADLRNNKDKIFIPNVYSEDGETLKTTQDPVIVDSKRVQVLYRDDIRPDGAKGIDKDGMIELRRGVDDISMGKANYCQVRIDVDGTHYIKGMAVYADDLPPGIDIRFNTNKPKGMPIMGPDKDNSVLKPLKSGKYDINPFGATVLEADRLILAQRTYTGKDGKQHQSALNIVSEEGSRAAWQNNISSQMLSKQRPAVAEKQLKMAADIQREYFDEIKTLTNPVVRNMKLQEFADQCDSAAVDMKAAGFPRQANHYILSAPSLGENEIYAPNYRDGERVVLIRYPHAGRFEIPELIVNNKNPEAKRMLGNNPPDAVCIHPKTAERLSGADFDGDSVLVIPNNNGRIKADKPLKGLDGFDPKTTYDKEHSPNSEYRRMTKSDTQKEMGKITNLITDMTVRDAPEEDIAKAVRHSMVVIDAEKHGLDYQQSYIDNDIAGLKKRYQSDPDNPGRTRHTLLSKAGSDLFVDERTEQRNTNKMTAEEYKRYKNGEIIWKNTNRTFAKRDDQAAKAHELAEKGYSAEQVAEVMGVGVRKARSLMEKDIWGREKAQFKSTYMAEERDPYKLSTGTVIENIYARYASDMKGLANEARRELRKGDGKDIYNPSAAKTYAKEVEELKAELALAEKNKPLENRAQLLAGQHMRQWKLENPVDAADKETYKKEKQKSIKYYRDKVGASRHKVDISSGKRWEAIQAGAIHKTTLEKILASADPETVTKLSMPKNASVMTPARIARAKAMADRGYTTAQIAENLGVSTSTVLEAIK